MSNKTIKIQIHNLKSVKKIANWKSRRLSTKRSWNEKRRFLPGILYLAVIEKGKVEREIDGDPIGWYFVLFIGGSRLHRRADIYGTTRGSTHRTRLNNLINCQRYPLLRAAPINSINRLLHTADRKRGSCRSTLGFHRSSFPNRIS